MVRVEDYPIEVERRITRKKSDFILCYPRACLFSFEQFAPVDLERIQKELQSSDTILLEYALGDDHSYLWAVTSNSSDSYVLPARREIEDAAREFFKMITARQGSDDQSEKDYQANIAAADNRYSEKASNLSRMLL